MIIGIDPGTRESAYALFSAGPRISGAKAPNDSLVEMLDHLYHTIPPSESENSPPPSLVIEMVGHYGTGMAVGREVFDTCVFIGRLWERWSYCFGLTPTTVLRKAVVAHLCGSARAKDGNVRQALIDRLGRPGTKKDPGPTYGITGDVWQALAVAVYHHDINLSKGGA